MHLPFEFLIIVFIQVFIRFLCWSINNVSHWEKRCVVGSLTIEVCRCVNHLHGLQITENLRALLNQSYISTNITKMPCWNKCWIKNSKKIKNHVGWKKIVLDENLIARKCFSQHFQVQLTQFSSWIGLFLVSSNIWFLWRHSEC